MLNGKHLRLGTLYLCKNNGVVLLSSFSPTTKHPWQALIRSTGEPLKIHYADDGSVFDEHECPYDLVKEYETETDTPEHEVPEEFNVVTKPKHYQLIPEKNIEVKHIVAILADRLGTNGYNGAFIADFAQMLQYLMRFDEKNGKEDLEKAKEFLGGMLEKYPDVQTLKGQK